MECLKTIAAAFLISFLNLTSAQAADVGEFTSNPSFKMDKDGATITLSEDLIFKDGQRRVWRTPAGYRSNGASIPKVLWSVIGGPLSGRYRIPAVMHDYFCDRRSHDWRIVHRAFYEGMRSAGVSATKAWIMYRAVHNFGPRWTQKIDIPASCKPGANFNPDECVVNSDSKPDIVYPDLSRENLLRFQRELSDRGLSDAAARVERMMESK